MAGNWDAIKSDVNLPDKKNVLQRSIKKRNILQQLLQILLYSESTFELHLL